MRAVLLTLLLAGASTSLFADDWSKQWRVSGSPEMHVETGDGHVNMTTGSGSQIEARVTTRGWNIGPGQVTITEHQDGNRVELQIHVPKGHMSWGSRSIEVEVRVPRGTANFIHTGDGAIEALDVDGSLTARTGDGSVHVRGRLDYCDVETGDGSIEAELASGSSMGSGWRMRSGDGHVTVRLPRDLNANLDAHTGDGSITVDMPITMEGGLNKSHDVHGKINGGGEVLTIHTGDGSIHIEQT